MIVLWKCGPCPLCLPLPHQPPATLFDFHAKTIDGENVAMMKYQTTSRVQLVVNVASGIAGVPPPSTTMFSKPSALSVPPSTLAPHPLPFPGTTCVDLAN